MYYTVIKHSSHLRTLGKGRKHSPAARAFYISLVFSNACRVLSHCNTRLRLLYLLINACALIINLKYNCLSGPNVMVHFSSLFNARISGRLDSHSLSNRTTSQDVTENLQPGARLHLIVQIPVLNIINEPENSEVILRQKEYIYCLRRNLVNPHVSSLRSFVIFHCNLQKL